MEGNNTKHLTNSTAFVNCPMDPSEQRLAKVIALGTLLVVSLVGNVFVCWIVYKHRNMRTTINYLLVNMAVSDLAVPIFALSRRILEISTGNEGWRVHGAIGNILCKVVIFVSDISPIVSILSLVMISFDRFSAIVTPLKAAKYPDKFRKYCIGLTWVIAILFCSPYFYFLGLKKIGDTQFCTMLWDDVTRRAYSVPVTVLLIIITFFLLVVMYSFILYKMKTKPKNLCQTERGKRRSQVSKRNITILSFIVVFTFAICWGPYFVVLMLSNFKWNWQYDYCSFLDFIFTVQFLSYSNSAINPILYFIFLRNFRTCLENLWVDRLCKEHKESSKRRRTSTFSQPNKDKSCVAML